MFYESTTETMPTRSNDHSHDPRRRDGRGPRGTVKASREVDVRPAGSEDGLKDCALALQGTLCAISGTPSADADELLWVHTLDGLRLVRNGKAIAVRGKGRALMVELLARGGEDVSAADVANALWPHGELDYAMGALNTTLYRLRKIPGLERALILHDGRIGFDRDECVIDQWLVDSAVTAATVMFECQPATFDVAAATALLGVLVSTYKGPLLKQDSSPTVLAHRAQLRARVGHILAHADALDVPAGPVGRSWQLRLDLVHPKVADRQRAH
ncbi:MAG: hypothetical protein AAF458_14810 [Pseudomonadota bacterium]